MISGGGQAIAARYRWLDGYGLRFESRSKLGSLPRASWINEWDEWCVTSERGSRQGKQVE